MGENILEELFKKANINCLNLNNKVLKNHLEIFLEYDSAKRSYERGYSSLERYEDAEETLSRLKEFLERKFKCLQPWQKDLFKKWRAFDNEYNPTPVAIELYKNFLYLNNKIPNDSSIGKLKLEELKKKGFINRDNNLTDLGYLALMKKD